MARSESGATQRSAAATGYIGSWFWNHWLVMWNSLRLLLNTPFATLMTLMIIGIAMALPAWLYLMLASLGDLQPLSREASISVYLEPMASGEREGILSRVRLMQEVADVRLVTEEEALAEFERYSGMGDVLASLDENPLSAFLLVKPVTSIPEEIEALVAELQEEPGVDAAVLDLVWLNRLFALLQLLNRALLLLALVLGTGVVLVVSNAIRFNVEARRDEIQILKLVGATDAYVRRPFLYTGLWFGIGGGLAAAVLILLSLWLLSAPLSTVTRLYPGLDLGAGISASFLLLLFGIGGLLGVLAAWLVAHRHLSAIQPR